MKKHHKADDGVLISGIAPDENNAFNRASDRAHGYSSRLVRHIRLSIGLRTSLGYSWLMVRLLFSFAFVLFITYAFIQAPNYNQKRREALELLPVGTVQTVTQQTAQVPYVPIETMPGVETILLSAGDTPEGWQIYDGWGLYADTDPLLIRLMYVEPYSGGQVQLLFSLDEDWRVFQGLLIGLCAMVAMAVFSFMTRGRKLNTKLLRPIHDITATAQQMNEKNMSARINVAGTQNELRDLAVVINDMLGRIEAGYNRQKQFVSDASHELRTPIAVLQGYAGLLERWGKDNPDVRDEAIEAIVTETQSMKELVENLLFLARHDKKTLSLTFEPFDSAEMLRDLVKETEIIATEHNILSGEIADCTLVADRASVKQGVRVFVDNAIKYTPSGGSVQISSIVKNEALLITVADSGPGIKKADLARIFDRFFRTDDVRNGQTSGHGLGLAIARIIAASHGGRIHAKSKPGEGSAFTLEIPLIAHSAPDIPTSSPGPKA